MNRPKTKETIECSKKIVIKSNYNNKCLIKKIQNNRKTNQNNKEIRSLKTSNKSEPSGTLRLFALFDINIFNN